MSAHDEEAEQERWRRWHEGDATSPPTSDPMRWEYRVVEVQTLLPDLNSFGAEGWEMFAIDDAWVPRIYLFKRLISEGRLA